MPRFIYFPFVLGSDKVRSFFSSWRFRILVIVSLLILGLMLRAATSGGFAALPQNLLGTVISPVQKLSAQISGTVTDFLASFTTYSQVKKENTVLKEQVRQLSSKLVNYDNAMLQNQQYKDFLGIKEENPDIKLAPAMVISRGEPDQWFSTLTIDKGSIDGIQKNDPVITADGVVGVTTNVMLTTSVVTTLVDPTTQIGCIVSRTGDTCISQGSNELLQKGQFRLNYIARDSNVSKGDIIITSGIGLNSTVGGRFPKGLKVGTVQDIGIDTDGMSLYAVVQPMANPSSAKYVSVITDFKGKADNANSQGGDK